jgi:hypothetical protein
MASTTHQLRVIAWARRWRAGATAAPMVAATFAGPHAETATEAQLQAEPRRVQAIVRSLENRVGVLRPVPVRNAARSLPEAGAFPAA